MRVKAPNKQYCGRYGVDVFVNGVCEDASETHRDYYVSAGYEVDGKVVSKPEPKTPANAEKAGGTSSQAETVTDNDTPTPPPRSATREEWFEFACSMGLDVDEEAKRSEIISAYDKSVGV